RWSGPPSGAFLHSVAWLGRAGPAFAKDQSSWVFSTRSFRGGQRPRLQDMGGNLLAQLPQQRMPGSPLLRAPRQRRLGGRGGGRLGRPGGDFDFDIAAQRGAASRRQRRLGDG